MVSILDIAKKATMGQAELLVKDTGYIPEDKLPWCPLGCAKTAADILREIAESNVRISAAVGGEQQGAAEQEFAKKVEQASGLDELGELVKESARIVCRVLDGLTEADLQKIRPMPWGAPYLLGEAIFLPASHMTYHDGQINYIQTLLGDSRFHWLEG
jgi:uncharacterized damage-inducible protein DinB